jgi:hypothetical protein
LVKVSNVEEVGEGEGRWVRMGGFRIREAEEEGK